HGRDFQQQWLPHPPGPCRGRSAALWWSWKKGVDPAAVDGRQAFGQVERSAVALDLGQVEGTDAGAPRGLRERQAGALAGLARGEGLVHCAAPVSRARTSAWRAVCPAARS